MNRRHFLSACAGAAALAAGCGSARAAGPRIASLDYGLAETLLVLGHPPVAVADARGWNDWVVEPPLPAGTVDLGVALDPNLELLTSLAPDLILTTDYLASVEGQLRLIAPVEQLTIYSEGGSPLPKAADATLALGRLIGQPEKAERYLAETEVHFDACRTRARRFAETPVLVVSFLDPRHVRVYGAPGLYDDVLSRIGLRNAWDEEVNYWGFSTLPVERLARVGKAFAIADHMPPDAGPVLAQSPLWQELPFVKAHGIRLLPPVLMFGAVPAARRFAGLLLDALEGQAA